ncbi:hypothetical protein FACS189479_08110 [Spirochaetia bacterium]|nr:hypothetical protein FACS189479_08110 [Spirochaetia bacterium]
MKKLLAILLILGVVVGGVVFAQDEAPKASISFGGWGRAAFSPLVVQGYGGGEKGEDALVGVGTGPGWDGIGAAVGFEVHGKNATENIGFDAKLRFDSGNGKYYANDSTAGVWVKPFGNILKITGGQFQVDDLRGKIGGPSETQSVGSYFGGDEDAIITRFESGKAGAHFALYPVDGFSIHASFGSSGKLGDAFGQWDSDGAGDAKPISDAASIYGALHVGAGYAIPNIGFARVQYIGGKYNKNPNLTYGGKAGDGNGKVQAAFQLTAVEGLNAELGLDFGIPVAPGEHDPAYTVNSMPVGYKDTYQPPIGIVLAAKYAAGDLGVLFRTRALLGESVKIDGVSDPYEGGLKLEIGVEPTYKIAGIGTLGVDLSFGTKATDKQGSNDSKNGYSDLGLGAWWQADIGGGAFRIGIAANIPAAGDDNSKYGKDTGLMDAGKNKSNGTYFTIPIVWTYSIYP